MVCGLFNLSLIIKNVDIKHNMSTYLNPKIIQLDSLSLTREITDDEIGVFRLLIFVLLIMVRLQILQLNLLI